MLTPIELIRSLVDGMSARGFGRIVNITSAAVKAPIAELGLSNGARAGLTGFVAGLARAVAGKGVTINSILPGRFATDRLTSNLAANAARRGVALEEVERSARASIPAGRFGDAARVRPALRLPVLDPCRLHHRAEPADRRRRLSRHAVSGAGRAQERRRDRARRSRRGSSPA